MLFFFVGEGRVWAHVAQARLKFVPGHTWFMILHVFFFFWILVRSVLLALQHPELRFKLPGLMTVCQETAVGE